MATKTPNNRKRRLRRHNRVRARVFGTAKRPRLAVFRSVKHISVQLIDDEKGHTLVQASDADVKATGNTKAAEGVGKEIAKRAKDAGITEVVFDRGGFAYHGRIKALADAARKEGLTF